MVYVEVYTFLTFSIIFLSMSSDTDTPTGIPNFTLEGDRRNGSAVESEDSEPWRNERTRGFEKILPYRIYSCNHCINSACSLQAIGENTCTAEHGHVEVSNTLPHLAQDGLDLL